MYGVRVRVSLVPRPSHVHRLLYSLRRPGPFYRVMHAADIILRHTRYGDIYVAVIVMLQISTNELEEPETGHACNDELQ